MPHRLPLPLLPFAAIMVAALLAAACAGNDDAALDQPPAPDQTPPDASTPQLPLDAPPPSESTPNPQPLPADLPAPLPSEPDTEVPAPEPQPTPDPPALILSAPLDVRDWPADDQPVAFTLEPGASIQIIGRTEDAVWLWFTVPENVHPLRWGWAPAGSSDLEPALDFIDTFPLFISPGVWVASTSESPALQPTFGDGPFRWTDTGALDYLRRGDGDIRLHFDPLTGQSSPAPPEAETPLPLRVQFLNEEPVIPGGSVAGLVDQAGNVVGRIELAPVPGNDTGRTGHSLDLSPDGQSLLVHDSNNRELVSGDPPSPAIRVLRSGEPALTVAHGVSPAWTLDGDILYAVPTAPIGPVSEFHLRKVDRDGNPIPLADEIPGEDFLQSLDGSLIATNRGAIADRDGGLIATFGRRTTQLDWSDDGRLLAFTTEQTGQVFIYSIDAGTISEVFDGDDVFPRIDLAPDGRQIAVVHRSRETFFAEHLNANEAVVHLFRADGTPLKHFLTGVVATLQWSPDSRWIAIGTFVIFN